MLMQRSFTEVAICQMQFGWAAQAARAQCQWVMDGFFTENTATVLRIQRLFYLFATESPCISSEKKKIAAIHQFLLPLTSQNNFFFLNQIHFFVSIKYHNQNYSIILKASSASDTEAWHVHARLKSAFWIYWIPPAKSCHSTKIPSKCIHLSILFFHEQHIKK